MADIRNTIPAAIQESPSPGSVAPPADGGNGPIVLVVPVEWIDGDSRPKIRPCQKSPWRNLINLWRASGWAVIFADFNAPLRLIHFGKKALLPGVTRIAHRQARSLCSARTAKFRSRLLHGSIHFRISHAADPDHARPNWMTRSEPILRRFHSRVLNLVGKQTR